MLPWDGGCLHRSGIILPIVPLKSEGTDPWETADEAATYDRSCIAKVSACVCVCVSKARVSCDVA